MDDLRHDVSLQDELCKVISTMDYEVLIPMVEQHHTNDTAIARIEYSPGHLQVMFPSKPTARRNTCVRALRYCNGDVGCHKCFTTSRDHMIIRAV